MRRRHPIGRPNHSSCSRVLEKILLVYFFSDNDWPDFFLLFRMHFLGVGSLPFFLSLGKFYVYFLCCYLCNFLCASFIFLVFCYWSRGLECYVISPYVFRLNSMNRVSILFCFTYMFFVWPLYTNRTYWSRT